MQWITGLLGLSTVVLLVASWRTSEGGVLPIGFSLRNLRRRWKSAVLATLGLSLVVSVFVALASLAAGFRLALRATGSTENAIVTQQGSLSELTSEVEQSEVALIAASPQVGKGEDGQPLVSPEVVVIASLPGLSDGQPVNVTFRGVTPTAFAVRSGVRITRGRPSAPGTEEIVVGESIARRVAGLEVGSRITIARRPWTIVGAFTSEGSAFESEIWGDVGVVGSAYQRSGIVQSVTVRLGDQGGLDGLAREVGRDPRLRLEVSGERDYYDRQSGPTTLMILALAVFVSTIMGIGAVFGVMNTMYAFVDARVGEIGMLRALGFSRASILSTLLVESVLLALVGGLLGCLLALPANGLTTATSQTANFSELAFAFRTTPALLLAGLAFSLVMGLCGGVLPAARACRLTLVASLGEGR
jgi:putative ABC transport system permease protein